MDSSRVLVPSQSDTTRSLALAQDSLAKPKRTVFKSPLSLDSVWNGELSLVLGFAAIDFPQRANFQTDLSNEIYVKGWSPTIDQPYPGSDICPRVGVETALRCAGAFRLVLGGWWQGWSAQAIAHDTAHPSTFFYRSYASDILVGSLGADLLISKSILRLDGGKDAHLGVRWLVGAGRLEGQNAIWGQAMGASLLAGAEFMNWKNLGITAQLGIDWLSIQSTSTWSDVLWNANLRQNVKWNAGGLSLMMSVRWGTPQDSVPVKKNLPRDSIPKPVLPKPDSSLHREDPNPVDSLPIHLPTSRTDSLPLSIDVPQKK